MAQLEGMFVRGPGKDSMQVRDAVHDAYRRLLSRSLETELRVAVKERADAEAIRVFAANLRELLLAAPLGPKRVMAIDPGFRTGCKTVCLDAQGALLHHETLFPHGSEKQRAAGGSRARELIETFAVEVIAVGNGTAGRETEQFMRSITPGNDIPVVLVNESGASIYSAEVLEESNAIGTAYLRTRLLPELYRTDAANLLRQYVDARLEFYEARMDSTKLSAAIGTSEQVQRKLWSQAIAASAQDPRSVSIALYLQSLNEVIDVHSKRVAAFRNRVPEIVLVLLLAVGILAMAVTGYGWAQGNRPHRLLTGILSILIALRVLVIMVLDRPRRGLIRVSQQSMIDLRDSLNEASP